VLVGGGEGLEVTDDPPVPDEPLLVGFTVGLAVCGLVVAVGEYGLTVGELVTVPLGKSSRGDWEDKKAYATKAANKQMHIAGSNSFLIVNTYCAWFVKVLKFFT